MKSRHDVLSGVLEDCLNEMYINAQPSVTFKELCNISKKVGKKENVTDRYYLCDEQRKDIQESYIRAYRIHNEFKDDVDIVINYLKEGGTVDKYIKPEDGSPGYRGYDKLPPLEEMIGKEAADKVFDYIEKCKDFYRFNREEETFNFNIFNYCPSSNLESVRKYWNERDPNVKIYERIYDNETDEYVNNVDG